jgi:hypothetical protein
MPKYYSSLCGIEGKSLLSKLYTQKTYIIQRERLNIKNNFSNIINDLYEKQKYRLQLNSNPGRIRIVRPHVPHHTPRRYGGAGWIGFLARVFSMIVCPGSRRVLQTGLYRPSSVGIFNKEVPFRKTCNRRAFGSLETKQQAYLSVCFVVVRGKVSWNPEKRKASPPSFSVLPLRCGMLFRLRRALPVNLPILLQYKKAKYAFSIPLHYCSNNV